MNSTRSSRARTRLLLATVTLGVVPSVAEAVATTWTLAGSGNWTTPGNWSNGVPTAGADIFVIHSDATNRTITYDYAGASINFNQLYLRNTGTGSSIFSQPANTFNAYFETINLRGHWVLSGGVHNLQMHPDEFFVDSGKIFFGFDSAGVGTISGGTLNAARAIHVGDQVAGSFNHVGGTVTAGSIALGLGIPIFGGPIGSGTYHQSGGMLSADSMVIGIGGLGTFLQSGGTSTIGTVSVGTFISTGILNVSGGVQNAGALYVGGTGTLAMAGVTLSGSGAINAFYSEVNNSTFTQTGGTFSTSSGYEFLAGNAAATYAQSGGTHTVGTMSLAGNTVAGTYSLSGGTLDGTRMDVNANGLLNMTAGNVNVSNLNINQGGTFLLNGGILAGNTRVTKGTLLVEQGFFGNASGPITFDSTGTGIIDGQLTSTSTITLDGMTLGGIGQLNLQAPFGSVRGSGKVTVPTVLSAGNIIADTSGLTISGLSLFNSGTIRNQPNSSLFIKSNTFNNLGSLIVNAGGGITVDAAFSNPANKTLSLLGGVLATPLLTNNQFGTVSGFGQITGSVTNNGTIVFIGPTQIVGNFNNTSFGHVSVRNAQTLITGFTTNNGMITTSNGTIIFDGGLAAAPPLAAPLDGGVDGAGSVVLNPGGHLISSYLRQSSLSIGGTIGNPAIASVRARDEGGAVSVLNTLSIAGGPGAWLGLLDLTDTALIANATAFSDIANYVISAHNGGLWNGFGITSSRADAAHGLGYADNSVLGKSTFEGQSVSPASTLVKYTWFGDANLDGEVDLRDLYLLSLGWLGAGVWTDGDFNYDGVVNKADLTLLARNWQAGNGAPLGVALDDLGLPSVSVPEPGLAGVMAFLPIFAGRRRRS